MNITEMNPQKLTPPFPVIN